MKIKIIVILCVSLTAPFPAFGAEWQSSWIDWGEPSIGLYPVMKITPEGVAHISYLNYKTDEANGRSYTRLRYLVRQQGKITADYTPDMLEGFDIAGNAGNYLSMAVDASGFPHICYCDGAAGAVKYAFFDGETWHRQTLETEAAAGLYLSLALDSDGNPHISYCEGSGKGLRYLYYDGTAWQESVVDAAEGSGAYNSLALDSDGLPSIAYYDAANGALKFASFDGAAWDTSAVDLPGDAGLYASLAVDPDGRPHIACYNRTFKALQYATRSSSQEWEIHFVVANARELFALLRAAGDEGSYCSLALDSASQPHISYFNALFHQIQYATPDAGGRWWVKEVPLNERSGPYSCLALDAADKPYIACFYSAEKAENN